MISIQALRKQEKEEQEQEARRQRELAAQAAARNKVQGFNLDSREAAPPYKEGVLKFARFLYDS